MVSHGYGIMISDISCWHPTSKVNRKARRKLEVTPTPGTFGSPTHSVAPTQCQRPRQPFGVATMRHFGVSTIVEGEGGAWVGAQLGVGSGGIQNF